MPEPAKKSWNPFRKTFGTIAETLNENPAKPMPPKKKPVPITPQKQTPARQAAAIETMSREERAKLFQRYKKQIEAQRGR